MSVIDDLKAAVAEATTVERSAVTLIQGLSERIRAAAQDPDELESLAQQLETESANLSAAVAANTTAEDEPPADDEPTAA